MPASAVLTWVEWVKHHPPEIVIIEILHLVFMLVIVGLYVAISDWIRSGWRRAREK